MIQEEKYRKQTAIAQVTPLICQNQSMARGLSSANVKQNLCLTGKCHFYILKLPFCSMRRAAIKMKTLYLNGILRKHKSAKFKTTQSCWEHQAPATQKNKRNKNSAQIPVIDSFLILVDCFLCFSLFSSFCFLFHSEQS